MPGFDNKDRSTEMKILKRVRVGRKVLVMLNGIFWSRKIITKTKK
jgi:hypothetical protein